MVLSNSLQACLDASCVAITAMIF